MSAKSTGIKPLFDIPDTGTQLPYDGEFTFDMIENWSGEGQNRAALVIQWNMDNGDGTYRDPAALVFGYRWDGEATGFDMVQTIVKNNPQLYALVQRTNVGCDISPIAPDGYTLDGIGWDDNEDGNVGFYDSANNESYYPEGGLMFHPRGGSGIDGSYPDYDYDNWKSMDETDVWQAGWYIGYWSYWVKDSEADQFGYSGWGMACRQLHDGSWDGWNYCPDMMPIAWREFMPAPALIPDGVQSEFSADGISYRIKNYNNSTVSVIAPLDGSSYSAAGGSLTIPSKVSNQGREYTVVALGNESFAGAEIPTVSIPSTVTSIGKYAFAGSAIESIELPQSVIEIQEGAFMGCSYLTEVNIPANLPSLSDNVFAYSGIAGNVAIPETVLSIGSGAFEGCAALTGVEIPKTARSIMNRAFAGCGSLSTVKVFNTEPIALEPEVFADIDFSKAVLLCPKGYADTYKEADVWSQFSLFDSFLLDVAKGDRFIFEKMPYEIIGYDNYNLTVRAKYHHFDGNHRDTAVEMANRKFAGDVVVPAEVTYMDQKFKVVEVSDSAFFRAKNLTSVTIAEGIKVSTSHLFDGCEKLKKVSLSSLISNIGDYCFNSCANLEAFEIPEGVTSLGKYAFAYCSKIKSFKVPDSVTSLGERVFFQCSGAESILLPASVTEIPNNAFAYCSNLKSMHLSDNVTSLGSTVFQQCVKLADVTLPSRLSEIPASTFSYCKALAEIEIPASVTVINNSAFENCSALNLKIPAQVTKIGSRAFASSGLTEVVIPEGVKTIETSTFSGCAHLTSVKLHDGITSIGSSAFANCASLSAINLPANLSTLSDQVFKGCAALTAIQLPERLTSIGTSTFEGAGLTSIALPESMTSLGGNCFNATKISALEIPARVTKLGANIFFKSQVEEVHICDPAKISSIMSLTFHTTGTSTKDYKYAKLIVPIGSSATLLSKTYWKNSEIVEPIVAGVTFPEFNASYENRRVALSATSAREFDSELPSRFRQACDLIADANTLYSIRYAPVAAEPNIARSIDTTAWTEIAAEKDLDGNIAATVDNLHAGAHQFAVVAKHAGNEYVSEPITVDVLTAIDSVCDDAATVSAVIYDLNGRLMPTASALPAGVYIKVEQTATQTKITKITVK